MAERYDEWERHRWRDVDQEPDPRFRNRRSRDFRRMRNVSVGPAPREYSWETDAGEREPYRGDDYDRSDFARSDRPQQYGRRDFGREPYRESYGRGDFARSDRPQQYGRGYHPPRVEERYARGNYARGDYGQREVRRRFDESYEREPYDDGSQQGYGQPTTWSYTEYWLIPGPFTGTGPSGYQRSDERVLEDVCERMTRHGYLDASSIEVEANDGIVTLRGTVDSRRTKRMAEDTAESVAGVWDIDNRLTVRRGEEQERVESR